MHDLIEAKVDTPFGVLDLTIENFYMSGRINEVVTINRVDYGIEVVVRFVPHLEDWQIVPQIYRAIPASRGFYEAYQKNGQPYARTRNNDMAMSAAQKHVNTLLTSCLTQWIDQNVMMIIQAQHTTKLRTVERAAEMITSFGVAVERAGHQMAAIQAKIKNHESLTDKEVRTMENVLDRRYWLW